MNDFHITIGFGNKNQPVKSSCFVLAGDIGATKSNLALFSFTGDKFSVLKENNYRTKDFNEAGEMIVAFLSADEAPDLMCFGVAGPVQDGMVSITNLPMRINGRKISAQFNDIPVYLINDLEATAYGLAMLNKTDIHSIYEPGGIPKGNIAIIAPGTGLGEAGLYWDGNAFHPFATEGGHCDFAPRNELDTELFFYLQKRFDHVSWERLISGPGISAIYEFLHVKKDMEIPSWLSDKMLAHDPAAVISENAERAAICEETMKLFFRYLATEAANLALKVKATGGIFIGGGIIPKISALINNDLFLRWFRDFGRMETLLHGIPVRIIMDERAALLGAACYGRHKN